MPVWAVESRSSSSVPAEKVSVPMWDIENRSNLSAPANKVSPWTVQVPDYDNPQPGTSRGTVLTSYDNPKSGTSRGRSVLSLEKRRRWYQAKLAAKQKLKEEKKHVRAEKKRCANLPDLAESGSLRLGISGLSRKEKRSRWVQARIQAKRTKQEARKKEKRSLADLPELSTPRQAQIVIKNESDSDVIFECAIIDNLQYVEVPGPASSISNDDKVPANEDGSTEYFADDDEDSSSASDDDVSSEDDDDVSSGDDGDVSSEDDGDEDNKKWAIDTLGSMVQGSDVLSHPEIVDDFLRCMRRQDACRDSNDSE